MEKPDLFHWDIGTRVCKKSGANWHGKVVGFYSTSLTPEGYAVESVYETGSVQIYPKAALTLMNEENPCNEIPLNVLTTQKFWRQL